jgi:serine phosphatase RsbU (regulator of sigma subunit)
MRLVVADPEEEASRSLVDQLEEIGYPAVSVGDYSAVLSQCEQVPPELVICAGIGWASKLVAEQPRIPVVVTSKEILDRDLLLRALRSGITDAWQLPMTAEDLRQRLAETTSRIAVVASDAQRKLSQFMADLERDQRAGRYIQMGMLPPNPMSIDQYRFQHRILPSLILSGDFVDYFRITDRHFGFYMADVSGHGASSAFVTVLLKNFSRRLRREYRPAMLREPGGILQWINRELLEQNIDKHVAIMFGVGDLQEDRIALVNGGHYPPAIRVSGESVNFVEQKGKPVGLFDEVDYVAQSVSMAPGDRLVMFSDGVLDAMGDSGLPEKESRLLRAAAASRDMNEVWDLLDVDVDGMSKPDDMTCLVVRRER